MDLYYHPDNTAAPYCLAERTQKPGTPLNWDIGWGVPSAHVCEVYNYGSAPIFAVMIAFKIEYRANEKTENGSRAGEIVSSQDFTVRINKLDPGKDSPFVFYAYNQSNYWAYVAPPENAEFSLAEQQERRAAKVMLPQQFWTLTLPPYQRGA